MSERAGTATPAAAPSRLVLIAEDEGLIAELLADVVVDAGFTPLVAFHGRRALELARQQPPDLVIVDLMLPYLSGADLIQALRTDATSNGHAPPVAILITGAGPRQVRDAGAEVVLFKPFEIEEIDALLHRFLGSPPPAATPVPDSAT
jgi:DNA-binding response OmpR family regulator